MLNNQDSEPGSLRDTIAAAASGDTIDFDPSLAGQITLTSNVGRGTEPERGGKASAAWHGHWPRVPSSTPNLSESWV